MELSYPHICSRESDIPSSALKHLDDEIVTRLELGFTKMFPKFAQSFIRSSQIIENHWGQPKLALRQDLLRGNWLGHIVLQTNDKNLFFRIQPAFMEKEGDFFDETYEMLPLSWIENYRWFNSFVTTEERLCPNYWTNTPFRYEARLDLDEYNNVIGATNFQKAQFTEYFGSSEAELRFWLLTENQDALFINESACDRRAYHVNGRQSDIITELLDPGKILDEYLAHYLSGGKPSAFDFIAKNK